MFDRVMYAHTLGSGLCSDRLDKRVSTIREGKKERRDPVPCCFPSTFIRDYVDLLSAMGTALLSVPSFGVECGRT